MCCASGSAAALWRFWEVRGRLREGRDWLEAILAEAGHDAPAARAGALNGAGNLARDVGDYARARPRITPRRSDSGGGSAIRGTSLAA